MKYKIAIFSFFHQEITLFQSDNMIFQFAATIELFCYGHGICVTDITRFKSEITTQHQFDQTYIFMNTTFWNLLLSSLNPEKKIQ